MAAEQNLKEQYPDLHTTNRRMTRNQEKVNSNSYNSNCDGKDIYFYQNRLAICLRFHIIFLSPPVLKTITA